MAQEKSQDGVQEVNTKTGEYLTVNSASDPAAGKDGYYVSYGDTSKTGPHVSQLFDKDGNQVGKDKHTRNPLGG